MDVNQRWPVRFRYPIIALAGLLVVMVGLASAGGTSTDLEREAGHGLLRLPRSSVADVLLSENGQLAVANAVTFDREKGFPERLVYVVDLQARRLHSHLVLPAVSCCAFPVFSTTSDGQVVAIGGADRVELFSPSGAKLMDAALKDPAFNTALKLSRDGRIIVAGQSSGRITAFQRGRPEPLWSTQIGEDLLDLAISGDGRTVVAATLEAVSILAGASGSVLKRIPLEPALPVAVAPTVKGDRIAIAWKRDPWQSRDARVVVAMLSNGRWVWRHTLQEGTIPLVQVDAWGKWVAVGDLMGAQGALVSGTGKIAWRSDAKRAAVTVASDGRAAIAEGSRVEIRDPAGQVIWRGTLPGMAHLLRLAGPTLAVLGSKDSRDVVADHLWFVHIGAESR
ncbi:MAG: YncE family protein [Armatimonadota bacterium]